MKYKTYVDVVDFALVAEPILIEKEDINSLFLGVLQAIKAGVYENPYMAAIKKNGKVVALIQMTPPHPLNLILIDENCLEDSLDLLITKLIEHEIKLSSIISLKPWAYRFMEKWEVKTGVGHQLVMDQGLYRLEKVDKTLEISPGTWRYANERDCALIEKWFNLFEKDAGLPISPLKVVKKRVASFVKNREIFLWENGEKVVSMMKKSRPTKHGITVALVFTPNEERRKGYARTLVAIVSKELLKDYDFCILYTDLMNPTSNKIYKEIGYNMVANSMQLGFSK